MPQFLGEGAINETLRSLKTPHLHIVIKNIQKELARREKKKDVRLAGQAYQHGSERSRMLADAFLFIKHNIIPTDSPRAIADFLDTHDGRLLPVETAITEQFDVEAFIGEHRTHRAQPPVKKVPTYAR